MSTFVKTIWVSKKADFEKKINHLNRLLAKQGKNPIRFKYTNYHSELITFQYHTPGESYDTDRYEQMSVEMCDVECVGDLEIKKDDQTYTYLGMVTFEAGIKQVFCKEEKYSNYFMDGFKEGYCDHCKTTRTNRKAYYLFRAEDDTVLQVGSTCAKEFFGIDSSAFLSAYGQTFMLEYVDSDDMGVANFDRGIRTISYEEIVPLLDYATQGFLKWNKKEEGYDPTFPPWLNATVEAVRGLINSKNPHTQFNASSIRLTREDAVAHWEAKKEKEGDYVSTFTYNALATLKAGYATIKSLGPFCYAVFAAYNHKVKELQEAAASAQSYVPCSWEKGTRTNIRGVIINVREYAYLNEYKANYYNRYWGEEETKFIVDFKDEAGTLYHFTTSSKSFDGLKAGTEVEVRGKIEETKPYKGVPYTRLSRPVCSVITPSNVA